MVRPIITPAQRQAQAALEYIARLQRAEMETLYDWYGGDCPCGPSMPLGDCRIHPRARLNQRPGGTPISPYSDWWRVFAFIGGRGSGKTFMGAQYVWWCVANGFAREIVFVNATIRDTIDLMVEGPSGILKVVPSWLMQPGNEYAKFYPSKARVDFKNGAKAYLRTSEEPDGLRGPNIDLVWGDEPGKWVKQKETWDQIGWIMRNRVTPNPRCILTGTPMPSEVMFELEDKGQKPEKTGVTYVTCHMDENAAHLDPQFLADRHEQYDGTLMGQQEMAGILIRRKPGALWGPEDLDKKGFLLDLPPSGEDLEYVGVGLDPASGSNDEGRASEAGVVVAGRRRRAGNSLARGVVLADYSCSGHPSDWGHAAIRAYIDFEAEEIVYEINQGGEMIVTVVRTTPAKDGYPSGLNIPMRPVYASRGKTTRAEESQVLYQAGRVQHVRGLDLLERQMILFMRDKPGQKLDRVDALVWILKRAVLEQDVIQDTGRIICGLARPDLDWIGDIRGRL
jgi:phage terminase large subunit-like protein